MICSSTVIAVATGLITVHGWSRCSPSGRVAPVSSRTPEKWRPVTR
jgi:hypothetical protein